MTALHPSTDCEQLYRAILHAPDDDTVRLAWADALEENAGTVECPRCKGNGYMMRPIDPADFRKHGENCPTCSGSCSIPDGLAARAEFVRVQIENERKRGDGAFNHRESALLGDHEASWRRGARCERCEGDGKAHGSDRPFERSGPGTYPGPCPICHGHGWMGSLAELGERGLSIGNIAPPWRHKADWQRGLICRVHAPLADIWTGDGPSEWAVRVRGEWPCEKFSPTDDGLISSTRNEGEVWFIMYSPLPLPVSRLLRKKGQENFDSPAAARLALSRALGELVTEAWRRTQTPAALVERW